MWKEQSMWCNDCIHTTHLVKYHHFLRDVWVGSPLVAHIPTPCNGLAANDGANHFDRIAQSGCEDIDPLGFLEYKSGHILMYADNKYNTSRTNYTTKTPNNHTHTGKYFGSIGPCTADVSIT